MTAKVTLLASTKAAQIDAYDTTDTDWDTALVGVFTEQVTDAEALIEYAGRVCYRSVDKFGKAWTFIPARIREGHEDILEHASATFLIQGISRSCSHQLVRHRLASYSQESQRYVDQGLFDVVVPPKIAENPEALETFQKAVEVLRCAYDDMRAGQGVRKEDARFLMPEAATTRVVMTMNLRSWRHFIEMRCDKAAQWEIRDMTGQILAWLMQIAPTVFADLCEKFRKGER